MNAPVANPVGVAAPRKKRGVVLINVGTPEEPTPRAVRKYLAEFLGDPKVIDLPAIFRWLLLNLIILPFRPKKSAHAYQQIWTPEGSPLLLNSQAQTRELAKHLPGTPVELAMRYGTPSIRAAFAVLRAQGITDVTVVPLYPQYAEATTGTTELAVAKYSDDMNVSFVEPFFAQPGFLEAYARRVKDAVKAIDALHVLFSYHGLPVRQVKRQCTQACAGLQGQPEVCPPEGQPHGQCYRSQCYTTSDGIAKAAGLTAYSTSFQSRLKGAAWLSPFTDETLAALARSGVTRVAIACPSFVADCLETLEEIGIRARDTFKAAGGVELKVVPALNDDPQFIETLTEIVRRTEARPTLPRGAA